MLVKQADKFQLDFQVVILYVFRRQQQHLCKGPQLWISPGVASAVQTGNKTMVRRDFPTLSIKALVRC